ncbi:hypothetical protein [Rubrobacter indicoceani]|uniref:hypothetical protein n=1 Tax=Rubrobacter indicoceani TaxID=2051957 RepID=UPI000E5B891D|nr:hypothetical protein [Rubrobacter indicoceani]
MVFITASLSATVNNRILYNLAHPRLSFGASPGDFVTGVLTSWSYASVPFAVLSALFVSLALYVRYRRDHAGSGIDPEGNEPEVVVPEAAQNRAPQVKSLINIRRIVVRPPRRC